MNQYSNVNFLEKYVLNPLLSVDFNLKIFFDS